MQLSFWEKQWLKNADIVVLGSGIVGLQCAIHLKNKYKHRQVWVIDRAPISFGASTRNAGFACFGSMGEILDDASRMGEKAALDLYEMRFRGLEMLLHDFGASKLGYENTGGYEIFKDAAEFEQAAAGIDKINSELRSVTDVSPFEIKPTAKLGMHIHDKAIHTALEGTLQTHLLYDAIHTAATAAGVRIFGGFAVRRFQQNDAGKWHIETENGYDLLAKDLILCTNGFSKSLLPELQVTGVRGQVLVTSPIPGLAWRGLMHADKGYLYFRALGSRILIGGARNTDFETETTTEMEPTEAIQSRLRDFLEQVVIPGETFEVEHSWAGIMGMDADRSPIVQKLDEGLYACVRMGGMGVALSALVSRKLAEIVEP